MKSAGRATTGGGHAARGARASAHPGVPRPSGLAATAALLVGIGVPAAAWSQGLADPMRPPPGLTAGETDGAAAGGPVLQSVMISPSGSAAIISGEMVRVGQKFGDSVLVKVAENEVVLRGTDGVRVLKLHPGVDKRPSEPPAGARAPGRGKAGKAPAGAGAPRQGER